MGCPMVHFEILGKDGMKLQSFYSKLFGWEINANNPWNYGLVDTKGGSGINGGVGPTPDGSKLVTVYIEVPDLAACLKQVEKAGGKTIMPPTEIPGAVTMAKFADPEGNIVGLVKSEQSQQGKR